MIERTFKDIPDGEICSADQQSFLVRLGWSRGVTWDDLLQSKRVLMVSEAGAGKTYECQTQARRLWTADEAAFFVELAALATDDLRNLLDTDEESRLDRWLASQSEVATFFLDSIDELKLTSSSFRIALNKFKKSIKEQLHRVRIVITTRPIPFDEQLIRNILPIPPLASGVSTEEAFAQIAMREHQVQGNSQSSEWRSVALMPLSDQQIIEFARVQKVRNPDFLLSDLQRRNAQEFARRPQDLIELCADWLTHQRIRTHRNQVASNVRVKLLPRTDRSEPAALSLDKAIEGASRLALATQMTRRLTIRHSAASDVVGNEAALDPAVILSDWQPNEIKALLERPLFGFASYGRVRFHHRSVAEYLAAERLVELRRRGMPFRSLKRILFAETKGKTIVRPSKRALAGWLALQENGIFELLRDNEPAVLLDEGDPESLTQQQRNQALRVYAEQYGHDGWRGLRVPHIQVHRFASKELASEIDQIWQRGIENPEVRKVLLCLIEAGCIDACADIAFDVAQNTDASPVERITAIDALVVLDDKRLSDIATKIVAADKDWPERVARGAVLHLFPKYIPAEQFCQALQWIKQEKQSVLDFGWQLPRLISSSCIDLAVLEKIRDGLVNLVSDGLKWQKEWPHITSNRPDLCGALAATCVRSLDMSLDERWLYASVLVLRLHHRGYREDESTKLLRERLSNLNAESNARLFWVADSFLQSLHEQDDPWARFAEISIHDGAVPLRRERDLTWILEELGDIARNQTERAMLLEAAIRLSPDRDMRMEYIEELRAIISDQPSLLNRLNDWLKPSKFRKKHRRWEKQQAAQREHEARRKVKKRASWIQFWREVANRPEESFSSGQGWNTAWNLWRAMSNYGDDSRSSGWNRRLIEELFNPEIADRLRRVMMTIWRSDLPTLASERLEGERDTSLVRWQLGLAAIYAEAEDLDWATNLSVSEAELAARYAPIELNGFPQWIESLVVVYPNAVDQILGNELSWELNQPPGMHGHSSLLQDISYSTERVARLFLPRLESWLDSGGDLLISADDAIGVVERVRQVTQVLVKYGDTEVIERLQEWNLNRLALQLPYALRLVWLSTLMRINPQLGVKTLASQLEGIEPAERSEAVTLFAHLFGDRQDLIDLGNERFSPQLLLCLLRLAYHHVRVQDDVHHEGSYTPDTRDAAEQARNSIVTALLNAKGEEGLAAKLEMASDPLCAHFKDRIVAVAEDKWAQEIDAEVLSESQAVMLDRIHEAPASTNEGMFVIMKDRLSDLDDLLLRDISPREAWAGITDETVMRREISRELIHAANSIYTVDQEAVTADEKETDIRLRSVVSKYEAVIELKLGDGRSANDLRDTISNQLVNKYMASEYSKAGVLLVTLSKDRKWLHPDTGKKINADELLFLLKDEARRVQETLGGDTFIGVHLLDLRARLPVESLAKVLTT